MYPCDYDIIIIKDINAMLKKKNKNYNSKTGYESMSWMSVL